MHVYFAYPVDEPVGAESLRFLNNQPHYTRKL